MAGHAARRQGRWARKKPPPSPPLKRIDVLTEPYTGEFQTGHYMYEWPDRAPESVNHMRVRARITDPSPASIIDAGTYTVRGKAWSGTGPVTRVDVSLTGEGDWHEAQL